MNSLLLLNGSPRGERSNSMKMLSRVAEGWERGGGRAPEVLHLARSSDFDCAIHAFSEANVVLLGMPLYTDAMPAIVKLYIESVAQGGAFAACGGANLTLGFLVQSGFPEALHSRPLERYLEKLARRLGSKYAGTIVRGGGESLQMMPDEANKKLWAQLRTLGEQLARDGRFGEAELKAVAGVERFSALTAAVAGRVFKLPIAQFYWTGKLKKNGVWERRFAAPYGPAYQPLN
ncbi:MAG: NAD(P)H-dependent oxidoreductase [Terracidiphilus sp.]|jgi:putative NADPH-quinone reductase